MPTTAKLVSGVMFALVAALAGYVYIPLLPEGTQTALLMPISAAIGFLCGWLVMGPNTGRSYAEAGATGLRTVVTTVFFATLGFAVYVMIMRSMRMLYHGPMDALLAVFAITLEYGHLMLDRTFLSVLAAGGILGGFLAEFAGRRWS
jgi:hypothetical protein